NEPDRLLSAVLFWNLLINICYFSIVSAITIRLARDGRPTLEGAFAATSLLIIIFFSEMLPKNLAVLRPRLLASLVSIPVALAVRVLDPIMPALRMANLVSRRLIWPRFEPEPYLELTDLERAIEASTSDAALLEQERSALQNIVGLSDIRIEEVMRPRTRFLAFRPPVSRAALEGRVPPSGQLLIAEPERDEVVAAVAFSQLDHIPADHLESLAEPVLYLPWCATVDAALDTMQQHDGEVVAVVNEYGETIGILTLDDILEIIFGDRPSRSARFFKRAPVQELEPGRWRVNGMTSLRRMARFLQVRFPPTKSVTVSGVLQEVLQRMPVPGDTCDFGPFHWKVLDAPQHGPLTVELTRKTDEGADR
ncbi:MAG: CNNM domain-containing protein, partial [Pirellulales bacterium]